MSDDTPIYELLKARLDQRAAIGLREYGDYLRASTDIDSLEEALDEALDLAKYLLTEIEKRKNAKR